MTPIKLRKMRIKAELKVADIAKLVGVTTQMFYYYEEGYRNMSPLVEQKTIRILTQKIEELYPDK